jgi:Ca2+-binding RTX toxin-like protein
LLVIWSAVTAALTASNSVGVSHADNDLRAVSVNDRAPVQCQAVIIVTSVVVGTNGTNGDELLVGSASPESLDGNKGDDCVLGGGGDDSLRGSQGTDVCIGGPGNDTFHPSCETQIQ